MAKPLFFSILVLVAVLCVYLATMTCSAPARAISNGLDNGAIVFNNSKLKKPVFFAHVASAHFNSSNAIEKSVLARSLRSRRGVQHANVCLVV